MTPPPLNANIIQDVTFHGMLQLYVFAASKLADLTSDIN